MYLKGIITYPRTDNNSFANYPDLYKETSVLHQKHFKNCKIELINMQKENKITDHGPICPLKTIDQVPDELQKKVLNTLFNYLKKVYSGANRYKRH